MPTTGPFAKSITQYWTGSSGARKRYEEASWYRNGAGPRIPHPYVLNRSIADSIGDDAPNLKAGYFAFNGVPFYWSAYVTDVHNKAYSKFVDKAQETRSSLGVTMAEWGQSESMIRRRAGQLTRAARALKRGYPYEFFKELGMLQRAPRRLPNRSDPKKAADLWLEWWFGWSPLIDDIHSSVKVLEAPVTLPRRVVRGVAQSGLLVKEQNSISYYDETLETYRVNIREKIQAVVRVTNPNLRLATQLGLMNPALILWERVPFSFVVDWIIPVGLFLGSWTDLLGLELQNPHTTVTRHYDSRYVYNLMWPPGTFTPGVPKLGRGYEVRRSLSYSGPVVAFRPYKTPSMTRAATAISLLLQQLARLPA